MENESEEDLWFKEMKLLNLVFLSLVIDTRIMRIN